MCLAEADGGPSAGDSLKGLPCATLASMKLSSQERVILNALDGVGVAPVSDVAGASSLSEHSVRYGLSGLIEQQLVRPFCSIDPGALGFRAYSIYFSLKPGSVADCSRGVERIVAHPYVSWLGEISGPFQYGCTVYARNLTQAIAIIGEVSEAFAVPWHRKVFYERTQIVFWPLKFFGSPNVPSISIDCPSSDRTHKIDELDHRILLRKSEDALVSNATLARECGEAVSTVSYRVAQLKERRIINGAWFVPNWEKLGLIHSQFSLLLTRVDPKLQKALIDFGRASPVCCIALACAGSWDFELNALTEDQAGVQTFQTELWREFGNYIESTTILSYTRAIKFTNYPFSQFNMVNA